MWPPIFRDARRGRLNPIGTQQMLEVLQERGSCIGLHPEGQRGKSVNSYELQTAKPGVGRMILETHPQTLIVPVFIHGLSNSFLHECRLRLLPKAQRRAHPIRWVFGSPIQAATLQSIGDAQEIADHLLQDKIATLARESQALQAAKAATPATSSA